MLTLDEEIQYFHEKAEELKNKGFDINTRFNTDTKEGRKCYECAKEYEQLAEWLIELKQRREAVKKGKWHHSGECPVCKKRSLRTTPLGDIIGIDLTDFCKNCGADMRGGVE